MIILSDKDKAFSCLSHKARLHLGLIEARTDDAKLLEAIKYDEPSLVKFYLDAGVSANSSEGSITSPIFYAAVQNNPLIVKMLLDYGANPYFEHKLTHSTIIGSVFNDYEHLMERHFDYPIVTEKLNKLVMIAAIMQHAGLRFETPNSKNESPLDQFGLWVGRERKEQVLAEFLEKINHADINSIRSTDVIARSPETIIRLSAEEEQQIALFRAGRYTEILNDRDDFSFSMRVARSIFNSRQPSQVQPSGSRTTLEDRIRRYTSRSLDYVGQPTADISSHIEETRVGPIVDAHRTPLAATEDVEDTGGVAEMMIVSERFLNSIDMYTTTGERFRLSVTSREEPTRPGVIAARMGFFPDVPRSFASSLRTISHATSFPADVELGSNIKKITDLNMPDEAIPNEYKCPLSLSIMSDPVYLQGDETGQRFERSWIAKWLSEHSSHPSTRKSFKLTAIQSDMELKTAIDDFIQHIANTNSLSK